MTVAGRERLAADKKLLALRNSRDYIERHWNVRSKTGERVRFFLNAAQRIVSYEYEETIKAHRFIRFKILKARQMGISTLITALIQARCQVYPGQKAISIADKKSLPQKWLDRGKRWHRETPKDARPLLARSNTTELFFEAMESRYGIGSARGQTPGMGDTLDFVHASEISNWPEYDKIMDDMLPAVPKNNLMAAVMLESTGEMEGDHWHDQIMKTLENKDDFKLIFLPWFIVEEYIMDLDVAGEEDLTPAGYTPDEKAFVTLANRWAKNNPAHAAIAEYNGIDIYRIAWRRWMIRNEFSGDVDRFRSKYPATIKEAFMGIGSMALPPAMVREHARTATDPLYRVQLERDIVTGKVKLIPFEGQGPEEGWPAHWCIWEDRRDLCEYAIGADVMVGALSDKADERTGRDWSVIAILNRRDMTTVAEYRGQVETDRLGEQMLLAGEYFNWAWMAPEANNPGLSVINTIQNYPYLYYRETLPDEAEHRLLSKMGWLTGANREMMISDWVRACRPEHATMFEGKIVCYSEGLMMEERTFVVTKTGKKEHRPGCHDDRLFAWMIALQVHLTCEHTRNVAAGAPGARAEGEAEPTRSSAFAGGVDKDLPGLFVEDDDGDWSQ